MDFDHALPLESVYDTTQTQGGLQEPGSSTTAANVANAPAAVSGEEGSSDSADDRQPTDVGSQSGEEAMSTLQAFHESMRRRTQSNRSVWSQDFDDYEDVDDSMLLVAPLRTRDSRLLRLGRYTAKCCRAGAKVIGDDWAVLTLLGVTVALIGFGLDLAISAMHDVRDMIATAHVAPMTMYVAWTFFACGTIFLAAFLTQNLSPHAIGSGIPQMKSILQGTVLTHYLSLRTLASKIIGLTLAEGSGLPIGKEGPFVHIASIIAEQFMKNVFRTFLDNESRRLSLLSAACAVGVASNFGAPIGGVLFSIEVTSTYFAVRNYWRGFYASVIGAFVFRLLAVVVDNERTITALFTTEFDAYPFDLGEMLAFTVLGALCGVFASFFVFLHRKVIETYAKYSQPGRALAFVAKYRYLYPLIISFFIATMTFPGLIGRHLSLVQATEINHLFTTERLQCIEEWQGGSLILNLVIFIIIKFILTILSITMPIPAGVFVPVFVIGAGFGRLVGEIMAIWFPAGLSVDDTAAVPGGTGFCDWGGGNHVVPGGYAVVGAAALAGGVTHTISTSVIVFELTGQIHHILPVMVAVLVANAICQSLSPSIYDSIIQIRGLPYLPDIRRAAIFKRTVDKVMMKQPPFVSLHCTYGRIYRTLRRSNLTFLPLVDTPKSMVLLGSVHRHVLTSLLRNFLRQPATQEELAAVNAPSGAEYSQSERVLKAVHRRRLKQHIDLTGAQIDPSPFQLVQQTSLHKVHVLFSTLGVNVAFVTNMGRLVGVVGIEQIRHAIQASGLRRLERGRVHPRQVVSFMRSSDDGGVTAPGTMTDGGQGSTMGSTSNLSESVGTIASDISENVRGGAVRTASGVGSRRSRWRGAGYMETSSGDHTYRELDDLTEAVEEGALGGDDDDDNDAVDEFAEGIDVSSHDDDDDDDDDDDEDQGGGGGGDRARTLSKADISKQSAWR